MNKELLVTKQQATSQKFTELQSQGDQKRKEIEELETEMARLQGEYRVYDALINEVVPESTPTAVAGKEKK